MKWKKNLSTSWHCGLAHSCVSGCRLVKNNPRCKVSASSWDTEGPVYNLAAAQQNVHVLQVGKEEWRWKKESGFWCVCPQIGDLKHYYSFRHHGTAKWTAESERDVTDAVAQEPEVKERDTLEMDYSSVARPLLAVRHTHTPQLMFLHLHTPEPNWLEPLKSCLIKTNVFKIYEQIKMSRIKL